MATIEQMTFPYGYGTGTNTIVQVRSKHQARYHPEAWRRIEAIMFASGGILGLADDQGMCGIGGGARTREEQAASYARAPNTFAPPDQSFHQVWDTWSDGKNGAQAIDWVGRNGRHSEAWAFLREFGGLYGLRTFWNINGEPWHSQMVEIPNSVSTWKWQGFPSPRTWSFPSGTPTAPPAPTPTPGNPSPADPGPTYDWGLWPYNRNKPTLVEGSLGDAVRYMQWTLRYKANQVAVTVDGDFGPKTEEGLKALQAFIMGPDEADGKCGPKTWEIIDVLNGYKAVEDPNTPTPPEPTNGTPPNVSFMTPTGLYWVQAGDSPWRAAERVYGNGALWEGNFSAAQFNTINYFIPAPGTPGRTTKVQPGEGAYALIKRMWPNTNQYAAATLARFYALNGGKNRTMGVGDVVFLDRPSDVS